MRRRRKCSSVGVTGPAPVNAGDGSARAPSRKSAGRKLPVAPVRRNYARWRALSLSLVYVVFAAHIIHWKITGKTLAPLELNEVMYTLELGIVTAGFLFMCFLVVGTLIFGRFFCSWACHIIVLQDLCAWMLRKLGIRRKPIRSRLLLLVPALTAFYMFFWPQILRAWRNKAFPTFHFATDAEGWASFATNDFWRNLPGAPIIVLTFLVCGFLIVYLLGSRTFCTYVCPYGAIFALVDRFAPGRIRVTDACQQCGTCTAGCNSGVRVHEEVKQHGMIVNPACLKDLDCVGACPHNALYYSFGRPSLFKSIKSGGRFGSLPYDFSVREDVLLAAVFIVVLFSFRGLYSRIPFLLSLALGGIIGYLAVLTVRLYARPGVMLATLRLKRLGRLTLSGRVFVGLAVVLAALVGHSGFVRYHEFLGLRQARAFTAALARTADHTSHVGQTFQSVVYDRLESRSHMSQSHGSGSRSLSASAYSHLKSADRWGLLSTERVERSLLTVSLHLQRFEDVRAYASRLLERYPFDSAVRLGLGRSLVQQGLTAEAQREFRTIIAQWEGRVGTAHHWPEGVVGVTRPTSRSLTHAQTDALSSAHQALGSLLTRQGDFAAAENELRQATTLDPTRAAAHAELGSVLAELGRLDEAVASLREAVRIDPQTDHAHYNLGTTLAHLGRFDEAIPCYERALATEPEDAELHNNLGFALLRVEQPERSREHLERAVVLDPNNADAHFNLGALFASRREVDRADKHYRTAARLDPRYAQLLGGGESE